MRALLEKRRKNPEFARLYAEEKLVIDALEIICEEMERRGIKTADLARLLGFYPSRLIRFFEGQHVSLRHVARVAHALGGGFTLSF